MYQSRKRFEENSSLLDRSKNRFDTSNNDLSGIEGEDQKRLRNPQQQLNNSTFDQLEYSNNQGFGSESDELNLQALQNNNYKQQPQQ